MGTKANDVVGDAVRQILASVGHDIDDVTSRLLGWEDCSSALEQAEAEVAKLFAKRIEWVNQREADRLAGRRTV